LKVQAAPREITTVIQVCWLVKKATMNRKTLDYLLASAGLVVAVVLLAAGGLLTWAHVYVADQVHDQLAMQDITMPAQDALETEDQHAALDQYAGEQMTTGSQAQAYADHYILVHMNAASDNRTYEEVSGEWMAMSQDKNADPEELANLAQLRQTLFMGTTLRGLLLNAYAFSVMGTIALYAAIVSFIGAGLMLVLALLGFGHARRVHTDVTPEAPARETVPA
jgi:methionine-rich copper-binding protein CopC